MAAGAQAWRTGKSGLHVLARVTPKSAHDGIDGVIETSEGPALKIRVRAVADKGAANRSVETVVARWLGVPKTRVTIAHGGKSRIKTLDIGGEPHALEALIAARVAALR
jgi:uncharacterized protein YggU (UPF0235/DUF167 family)